MCFVAFRWADTHMNELLFERLNKILLRITSDEFLKGVGIGNEIAFHIFEYPPEDELQIRNFINKLLLQIPERNSAIRYKHINLFEFLLDYLKSRNLLDKAIEKQRKDGNEALLKALKGPLKEEKIADFFKNNIQPLEYDLVIISGVGSAWPLLRSHALLNNLHPIMGNTPLVMFYPGRYDGQALSLFGNLKNNNYYRAFRL